MTIIKSEFELFTLSVLNIWDPVYNKNFWEATIEVPVIYSLFDLHLFIQKIINFDNDHLFEFYAGRNYRNRKLEFSKNAGHPFDGGDYETNLLKKIFPLKRLKLYYLFDLGDKWIFEIRKSRKKVIPMKDTEYPRIVSDNGVKLIQYFEDDSDE
jgi:hypothetical protein